MKKIKKYIYPVISIFFPIFIMIWVSIWLSSVFKLENYNGSIFSLDLTKLMSNHQQDIAFLILMVFQLFLVKKINKDNEFVKTDIYGDYPLFIYSLAYWIMGYKKVNLKLKPIPLQFRLLHQNLFDCYDDTVLSEEKFSYTVYRSGKLNHKVKQINIIVADTYDISKNKIPEKIRNNYTIKIDRCGSRGLRVFSKELVDLLHKEIIKTRDYCEEYNLFLTTPACTNNLIYNQIFNTGLRDGFVINVYQQDNSSFVFKEKPTKIKS